jgi:hypothetical protein
LPDSFWKVGGIWSHIIFRRILFEGADEKVGGIWSHIIFCQILFEGANEESWRDLEPYNLWPDSLSTTQHLFFQGRNYFGRDGSERARPRNIYFFEVVIILGETEMRAVVRGPDHSTFIF